MGPNSLLTKNRVRKHGLKVCNLRIASGVWVNGGIHRATHKQIRSQIGIKTRKTIIILIWNQAIRQTLNI